MQKYAVVDYEKQAVIHASNSLLVHLIFTDSSRSKDLQETIWVIRSGCHKCSQLIYSPDDFIKHIFGALSMPQN